MLNKNDPLIGAVQEVMKKNQAEREAARLVNEKFGVTDRKALPHERQGEWDAAYKSVLSEALHPNQEKLDLNKNKKLDKQDFKMLRAKKPMEEATDGDTTSPSSMGIKKPDYATGTPDYANKGPQMVNRAAKTSLPAGTMKEEEQIDEVLDTIPKAVAYINKHNASHKKAIETGDKNTMRKRKRAEKLLKNLSQRNAEKYAKNLVSEEETLEEREMTSLEKTKEKKLKAKLDSSKMKASMQKQYGKEEGKKIYFATIRKKAMKEDNEGFNGRHGLSVTASAVKQVVAEQARARSDYGLGAIPAQKNAAKRRAELDARMEKGIDTVAPFIPGVGAARAIDKYARGQQGLGQTAADVGLNLAGGALVTGAGKLARMGYNALRGARTAKNLANPAARGAATAADKSAGAVPAAAAKKADDGAKAATSLTSRPTLPAATAADKSAGAVPAAAAKKADDVVSVGDKFRVNAANRRYSPAGAEAKPPTAPPKQPTTQSGVPAIVSKKGPGRSNVERVGPFNPIGPKAPARPTTPNAAAGNAARVAVRQRLATASKDNILKGAAATGLGVGALKVAQNQYSATSPATAQNTTAGTPAAPKPAASTAQAPVPKARPVTAPAAPAAQAPKPAAVAQQRPAAPVAAQPSAAERRENRRLLDRGQVVGQQAIAAQQRSGTGVTIQQKAAPQVKRPVGTGREK